MSLSRTQKSRNTKGKVVNAARKFRTERLELEKKLQELERRQKEQDAVEDMLPQRRRKNGEDREVPVNSEVPVNEDRAHNEDRTHNKDRQDRQVLTNDTEPPQLEFASMYPLSGMISDSEPAGTTTGRDCIDAVKKFLEAKKETEKPSN